MSRKVVLFGTGDIAEIAYFYLKNDSDFAVQAFTVDGAFLKDSTFCGLPTIAFEEVIGNYSPDDFSMFIAVSYAKMNQVRKQKYEEAKAKGYHLISYISSRASHWGDTVFGDNCFILEDNTIQPFVRIGNNVTLWSGNHIGHHSSIADHCFLASHIVVSGGVKIGESCFIGVNATLRDHITIANSSLIGAGALILKDTEPCGVYTAVAATKAQTTSDKVRSI